MNKKKLMIALKVVQVVFNLILVTLLILKINQKQEVKIINNSEPIGEPEYENPEFV